MYTKDISSTYEKNLKNEWLLTNGIGGFASSTLIGANTRKYHGLLVAALGENLERYLVLPKVNEYVEIKNNKYSISTNECHNYIEKGYVYQEAFERKLLPEFLFNVEGVHIVKKIAMVYGENKIAIKYNIVNTLDEDIKFDLAPFVNFRNFHSVKNAKSYEQHFENEVLEVTLGNIKSEKMQNNEYLTNDVKNTPYKLFVKVTDSEYNDFHNTFYKNMYYRVENSRGFDDTENHFMPGEFSVLVEANMQKEVFLVAEVSKKFSIEDKFLKSLVRSEEIRLEKMCKIASAKTDLEKDLVIAADNFIISKDGKKTIIAGYPWFNDWGRDTFIALEGLTLKTNRFNDAKNIIKYFSKFIKDGLVPNYIQDGGGQSYNTVDASLWFIEAVNKYSEYTNDLETLVEVYPKIIEIIASYKNGTLFDIKMQNDGLISAGNERTQLTWMDAKVGEHIPTPRYGKAVEINALWYNALKVAQNIYKIFDVKLSEEKQNELRENIFKTVNIEDAELSEIINGSLAEKVKMSFKKFYADEGLFDLIEPFNSQIRPNQIIAMSLSYPVLTGDKAIEVLNLVKDKLLTEKGIKTLNSEDSEFKARYEGDSLSRDLAYHQGTVWTWLLGEYAKAHENTFKKKYAFNQINELLNDGCIGNIAEIYDAEEPREANGALAQAWGVAAMMYLK
ncbi:MAG: glycogen debranching enzyme family protein [Clostridia bacterium]|nr:glycogen debranching enzyme family protein [Clostridia bacterium]